MTQARIVYLFGVIFYSFIAMISAKFLNIHWLHIFNALMLSSVFYNLLDFKFSCDEPVGEDYEEV